MKKQLFIVISMLSAFGASVSQISAAAAAQADDDSNECKICMDARISDQVHFQCGHKFCDGCYGRIYGEHRGETKCPLCRTPLIAGAADVQAAARGFDPYLEAVLLRSQEDASQVFERIRAREEAEAAQLADLMAESLRLEEERLERVAQRARQKEEMFLAQTRRLAEEQRQQRETEERRLRLQEEAEIARAINLSLEQQQVPALRQRPVVAPRPRAAVAQPALPEVAARPPMTARERILEQQRQALAQIEAERANRRQ